MKTVHLSEKFERIALRYGMIPEELANRILERFAAKPPPSITVSKRRESSTTKEDA